MDIMDILKSLPDTCLNPEMPLPFEILGGEGKFPSDGLVPTFPEIRDELASLLDAPVDLYIKPICRDATVMALNAYGLQDVARIKEVIQRALAISDGLCPEAHNALAQMTSTSYADALAHYQRAAECSLKTFPTLDATIADEVGVFNVPPLRAYFRAVHGLANTHRKMGQFKEAFVHYRRLIEIEDSATALKIPSFPNYRYHVPAVFFANGDREGCLKYMKADPSFDDLEFAAAMLEHNGCDVPWSFALAFLLFERQRDVTQELVAEMGSDVGDEKIPDFSPEAAEVGRFMWEGLDESQTPIASAVFQASQYGWEHIIPHIRGSHGVELDILARVPRTLAGETTLEQAHCFVRTCGPILDAWRDTPGALRWLSLHCNTMWAYFGVLSQPGFRKPPTAPEDLFSVERFRACAEDGIYVSFPVSGGGMQMIHEVVIGERGGPEKMKILLELHKKLGASVETAHRLTPLHIACYYDREPELITALLDAGARFAGGEFLLGVSPLQMAINQGNWRPLKILMDRMPISSAQDRNGLKLVFAGLAQSPVYVCVLGRSVCERCVAEALRGGPRSFHSPGCVFEKCVDVLIEKGMEGVPTEIHESHPLVVYAKEKLKGNNPQPLGLPRPYTAIQISCMTRPQLVDLADMWSVDANTPEAGSTTPPTEEQIAKRILTALLRAGGLEAAVQRQKTLHQDIEAARTRMMQARMQQQGGGGGHGHSHDGKPCHGHGHGQGQGAPQQAHQGAGGHGHTHDGKPCHGHGHGQGQAPPPQQQQRGGGQGHGHTHDGKPCHGHGHPAAPPQHSQQSGHGHTHDGKPCHGHGQPASAAPQQLQQQQRGGGHGHSHDGKACHGHG